MLNVIKKYTIGAEGKININEARRDYFFTLMSRFGTIFALALETIFDGGPLTHNVTSFREWILDEYSDTYHIRTHPCYKNAHTSDRYTLRNKSLTGNL